MSLINESPKDRRTISVEVDEAHYQFLLDISKDANDVHAEASHLADRILNQQLAEEMKQAHYLKNDYRIDTLFR